MDLEIVLTPGLGNATYLLASDGEAIVVDPPRDAWRVTAVADARGWRLTHVVETHVHNDYLSGALELRAARRAEIVAPARGRYAFEHRGCGRRRHRRGRWPPAGRPRDAGTHAESTLPGRSRRTARTARRRS